MTEIDWSMPSKRVEGSPVYNRNGERFGTIDHIMLDKSSVRHYAVFRFSTLLGISDRYYPVPWTKLAYDARFGGYIADIDLSRLQREPSYSKAVAGSSLTSSSLTTIGASADSRHSRQAADRLGDEGRRIDNR